MSNERKTTYVQIALNRASFSEGDHTFVILVGEAGGLPAEVPTKNITVNKQKVMRELSGTLEVPIIEENPSYDLVEVEIRPGEIHRLHLDKNTHQIKPIRMVPEYYEIGEYIAKPENIRDHT